MSCLNPKGFEFGRRKRRNIWKIREIRLSAGAEFIVAIAGDIMTMPGLPKKPAAYEVCIGNDGNIKGLF